MKPCRRCGGEKEKGWRGIYCPACSEAAAADRAMLPCRGCGGEKEPGHRARFYCATCKPPPQVPRRAQTAPIRRAFQHAELSKSDVARALGWYWNGRPDTARVARVLSQPTVNSMTAARVAPVLGLDPVDLGV